jgi:hypothetical protein
VRSVATVTVMGEPSRVALTSTPSMAPSSVEVTRPVRAEWFGSGRAGVWARLAVAIRATTAAIRVVRALPMRIPGSCWTVAYGLTIRQSTSIEEAPSVVWRRKVRCSFSPSLLHVISTSFGSMSLLKPENLK